LYNILIEFVIPMKLVRLIKMCLNETYSTGGKANICLTYYLLRIVINKVMLYRHSFSTFLQCAIRRVHVNKDGLKLNGTHQLLVNADDVNILDRSILTVKKTEALVVAIKEVGQYVNAVKLSAWSCLEIRMQDEVTGQRLMTFPLK